MKTAPLVLALLAAPLARAAAQQAPGYADAGHRFRVALPAGWAAMPDSAFQAFRRRAGADSTLVAAFLLAGSGPRVGYPYAILQVQAGEPVEPESLAATLSGYRSDSATAPGAAGTHGRFPAVYDRAAGLVRWGGFETLPDGASLRWYEGLRMTDFGFIALIMYGMADDSLATAARLDSLDVGLAIEASHRYRPGMAATARPPHTAFLEAWGAAGFLALAAVVLGVLRVIGQRQAESA